VVEVVLGVVWVVVCRSFLKVGDLRFKLSLELLQFMDLGVKNTRLNLLCFVRCACGNLGVLTVSKEVIHLIPSQRINSTYRLAFVHASGPIGSLTVNDLIRPRVV